ncbi:EAL domain-containing protein [Cytobacillus oceanisediminis]|jgi:EAL domain-containing protein (putative c-di-GMP-specific phosphodiesterase class I)|uniref:EAL domain-containing protein n=2 Tax=Niallia TaxID=2837506 RepID=A0A941G9V0_NIACI|nr:MULTISPECIES: EAL domain-containing protein [Bacillaceae]EOR24209.1 signal transduction protein [Niallia nealsonii AAU1]MBQ6448869.1 EAL domain-containing protein [Bacillus sp. (in: firmicutes)]MBZ9536837.1 EAL domain-containing protein [Cytobacillus oceanisediminis]MCB5236003.1 EAL domain-containing protein [Niallia circulans]MED3791875.1 EAL domain-containing protein [Niallia alba]
MKYQETVYARLLNWGKLFLPAKCIKYFPPSFVLRDPIIHQVEKAMNNGYEVAVIVMDITNLHRIKQQLETEDFFHYIRVLKKSFRTTIQSTVSNEIIAIHDYNPNGLTMFIRWEQGTECLAMLDGLVKKIIHNVESGLRASGSIHPVFNTGYMFIEKKYTYLSEAIQTAHEFALAMAHKRSDTEFNKLVYTLSDIVANKSIHLLAQPIMDVETNKIHACEMLTRGPKGTSLENPLQLFSLARQTKFLYELEMIVLEKAFEQIQQTKWRHNIFINFTPVTIGNPRFIKDIKAVIRRFKGISPQKITIEITERDSFEGLEHFTNNLKVLRMLGFLIAVDDTGAGYASLNSISEIMPDIIKIDRSVIQNIDKNSVKESMLKGLLLIAKEVGSVVVAEGIESAEEASILSKNKVDLAQGYFYAKPTSLSNHLQIS